MARTTTFGRIETRVRRDLLKDKTHGAYRHTTAAILSRANEAVLDIVGKINAWAGYDQETGRRIYDVRTLAIEEACDPSSPRYAEVLDSNSPLVEQLRAILVPIDDRYAEAVAYLTAAKILEAEDFNDVVAAKTQQYRQQGMELAVR